MKINQVTPTNQGKSSHGMAALRMVLALGVAIVLAVMQLAAQQAQQPIVAGPNVNIIGGPAKILKNPDGSYELLEGDPGQRQNEVSCFVDSRDPLDIGCAYNDYTPVAIAGLDGDGETGDAWIGQSVSTDGGLTWRKYMLDCYPQDSSLKCGSSPIYGLEAAADPTWVAGHRDSFLSAIAFNRAATQTGTAGAQANAVLFVQKYRNDNNVENDPKPFKPTGAPALFPSNSGESFQDKPWAGVAPNGDYHLVWATFLGGPNTQPHSAIYRAVCPQGDLTKCTKTKLSEGDRVLNGTAITFHPTTGWADITYRRRKSGPDSDAIMFVRCFDDKSCTKPIVVVSPPELQRSGDASLLGAMFDQGSGSGIFRNISNPTIAADADKRVYIAWAQRLQSVDPAVGLVTRDSKVMLTIGKAGKDGTVSSFSTPVTVDSLTTNPPLGRGHEIRPQMWFGSGKLYLSAAILHQDQTQGEFELQDFPDPGKSGGKILKYVETRVPKGELVPSPPTPTQVGRTFTEFIFDRAPAKPTLDVAPVFNDPNTPTLKRRHTEEIGLWTGTPGGTGRGGELPTFTFTDVWRSRIGLLPDGRYVEIDANAWGIEMFNAGKWAFAGDYDAVVTQAFVPNAAGTAFVPNISASNPSPVYVAWTDNRNVRTFVSPQIFTPACAPGPDGQLPPNCSCVPTAEGKHAALTRNQDIYIARAGQGLYVYVVGNQKPFGNATLPDFGTFKIKRAFPFQFQSAVNATKHYRAVIANQPTGGTASWKQFAHVTQLDLSIPPFSIAARELYASSTDPDATIRVNVFEIDANGDIVIGGLQSFAVINPDRSALDLAPPINNGEIDPTNPLNAEIFIPDPLSPDPLSANVDVTPDPLSPDPLSPDPLSPDPLSPDPLSPDPLSPDPLSPDPLSPDPLSPDPLSPDPLSVPAGGVMTDTIVEVNNNSNTSTAVAVKTFATQNLPAGSRLQIIITQPYFTSTPRDCVLRPENASPVLATVTDPILVMDPAGLKFDPTNPTDSSSKSLTVGVPPGGKFNVIYRWVDPVKADNVTFTDASGRTHSVDPTFNPAADLIPVVISQPVSTPVALSCGGVEQPPCPTNGDVKIPLSITTTNLDGVVGTGYSKTLTAIGGVPESEGPPYAWSVSGLPPGLALEEFGDEITGSPTQVGTFTVVVTVEDSEGFTASRTFTVRIFPNANLTGINTLEDTPLVTSPGNGGGSPITFNLITPPTHGTVTGDDPITYTPNLNYFGPDSFVYSITAAGLTSAPSTVAINVAPVNDVPIAAADAYTSTLNVTLNVPSPGVLANDTDVDVGDTLTAVKVADPLHGTLTLNPNGSFSYVPTTGFTGTDTFTYKAKDSAGAETAVTTVTIVVKTIFVSNTDVVSAGLGGMRVDGGGGFASGSGGGTITVSGVTGTVTKALLYWNGPSKNAENDAINAAVVFNGNSITGSHIGKASSNCWGAVGHVCSQSYMADVTSFVSGNGGYALAGFTNPDQPSESPIVADINGVSLVVFFNDGNADNNRDVYLYHGNDSDVALAGGDAGDWNVGFPSVNYVSGSASLELHVSDAQGDAADGAIFLNGTQIAAAGEIFDGTEVPRANTAAFPGWAIESFPVTLAVGTNDYALTNQHSSDCLSIVVAILSMPHQ